MKNNLFTSYIHRKKCQYVEIKIRKDNITVGDHLEIEVKNLNLKTGILMVIKMEIPLHNCDENTLVDPEDFDRVDQLRWMKSKLGYAHTYINRKLIYLH